MGQATFRFTNENGKNANAICVYQNFKGQNPFNHVFIVNLPSFFNWKK